MIEEAKVVEERNLILFTRPFLAGRRVWVRHETTLGLLPKTGNDQ